MKAKEKPWKISERYFLTKTTIVLIHQNDRKRKTMKNLKTLLFIKNNNSFNKSKWKQKKNNGKSQNVTFYKNQQRF